MLLDKNQVAVRRDLNPLHSTPFGVVLLPFGPLTAIKKNITAYKYMVNNEKGSELYCGLLKILKNKEFAHFAYLHPCTAVLHFWHKTLLVRRKYEKATNAKRH
jgi:hypothetical protein